MWSRLAIGNQINTNATAKTPEEHKRGREGGGLQVPVGIGYCSDFSSGPVSGLNGQINSEVAVKIEVKTVKGSTRSPRLGD